MTEQTQGQEPVKKTLEDLYAEFDPQPKETVTQTPVQPNTVENGDALMKEIQSLKAEIAQDKQARAQEQEEKDFTNTVAALAKASGIKGKETLLKGYILAKASEDIKLRSLWEGRKEQPKIWDEALLVLAEQAKAELTTIDPQLEENQRAMDASQQRHTSTAPQATSEDLEILKKSDMEFQQYWQSLTNRGY